MFSSAVICTDGSPESDDLLSIAPRLRQFGVKRVTLVCPLGSEAHAAPEVAERVLAQESVLSARGFEAHAVVRSGEASILVEQVAAEIDADFVFLGVMGLGRSSRVLVGGTANTEESTLCRPMLSVRVTSARIGALRSTGMIPMLSKVLLATDFSPASEGAIELVERMAKAGLGEVVVLHVTPEAQTTEDRLHLRALADRLRRAGCARVTEELVDREMPAEAITHRSHVGDITLTVVGSRGHGLFSGLATGSVGAQVARFIECPLLAVPPAAVCETTQDLLTA